jgi:fibronectin type 3 domain-containing protein
MSGQNIIFIFLKKHYFLINSLYFEYNHSLILSKSEFIETFKSTSESGSAKSHFVDTNLKQNSAYTYTFTTIKDGYESAHGKIINIKTLPPLSKVTFFQGAQKANHIIKMIWRPHPDKRVKFYRVERSLNGKKWVIVARLDNRLMAEYIDIYVNPGNRYQYRIIAIGFDGSYSIPSNILTINAK